MKTIRRRRSVVQLLPHRLSRASRNSLLRVVEHAKRRYGRQRNIVGVAAGYKFIGGTSSGYLSVQFFVRKKRRAQISRRIPEFMYGRRRGYADHSTRYPTDVIEVGRLQFSCGAGTSLDALGTRGSATLLFHDKRQSGTRAWYMLTCSHVVGDLADSPPVDNEISVERCAPTVPFALVQKNTIASGRALAYDLAIASLTPQAISALRPRLDQLDCRIAEGGTRLKGFIQTDSLRPGLVVKCQLGQSGLVDGTVQSYGGEFAVNLRGKEYEVSHLYSVNLRVAPGDSGGIVYSDDQAVGVMVAQAAGPAWAWFQPLDDALDYLNAREPSSSIRCF